MRNIVIHMIVQFLLNPVKKRLPLRCDRRILRRTPQAKEKHLICIPFTNQKQSPVLFAGK